mmetsp:Transcript_16050/g.22856  ORF Transcript_16050/g.22856 Transcript_16050/m.22856 type:complete len:203 (+) Transcript_16050:145-753(+)|eukprot:CAMPEP_0184865334 /NCGR_PEP_ID=MMETSP0580-20130426/17745_1 /TAXON_ID=1118495 /ORGANISM="Dactyliosolen fragilissimus" /LENGTH=202 /DNA_ID=CAMNT_0027364489 /DNA_START=64 /DNA_END=672 /DNA_ORIENTATION=-
MTYLLSFLILPVLVKSWSQMHPQKPIFRPCSETCQTFLHDRENTNSVSPTSIYAISQHRLLHGHDDKKDKTDNRTTTTITKNRREVVQKLMPLACVSFSSCSIMGLPTYAYAKDVVEDDPFAAFGKSIQEGTYRNNNDNIVPSGQSSTQTTNTFPAKNDPSSFSEGSTHSSSDDDKNDNALTLEDAIQKSYQSRRVDPRSHG